MKYLIKGKEYEFDFDFTLEEAFELKEKAYLTISELNPALARVDPHAVCAVAYFAMKRNREVVKWDDVKRLKLSEIVPVFEDEAPAEGDAEVDPTPLPAEKPTKSGGRSAGKSRTNAT
ncbi:hypothetical protein [Amycolatopsis kentuckyensis]|uniref:hypothetical protein n=1 Tax=Amycolatopsis kentuckyensis TaxID=218823 RepID=UPI000A38FC59|nr:hypothetical protein [Amycolatopsis kentuckyensis]